MAGQEGENMSLFFATWIEEEGPTLPFGWSFSHWSWSAAVCSSERKTRAWDCSLRDVKSESFNSADDLLMPKDIVLAYAQPHAAGTVRWLY